ncbi:MAG: aromatic ring-hydroxylating dioxygenase subunit alpha [Thermoleophilia bacterium]|nr:aromatic ring-hydroxylating dioxygenase subunit alpha [Thermoleophilia bacterium]
MRSLPWSWYTDPEVERLEREHVFRRAWQYVGRAEAVADPGSYLATDAGGVPVVITRDEEGALRAFVNVCRHRGSVLVADGAGRRETLQCRYHAWTYRLDGTLRSAPRAEELETAGLTLVPATAALWGPLLFVNPAADAPPLADTLGDVPQRLADAGVDLARLRFHGRVEYELAANWKVACENYLECYHCPTAHPGFSALVDVRREAYRLEADGCVASQLGPLRAPAKTGRVAAGHFHFVWPNLKLNVYPGHPNLSVGPVLPAGPERCRGFLDYFFDPDADDAWVAELLELDDRVGHEDRELVEGVQRGVRAGAVPDGPLLPESERLIVWFQERVADALGSRFTSS